MKYYKMVSGIGRVEITQEEACGVFTDCEDIEEQPSKLEILEKRVDEISDILNSITDNQMASGLINTSQDLGG